MKRSIKKMIIFIFFACITGIVSFYYYIGIGFGKSAAKSIKHIEQLKEKWELESINPIDSVKVILIEKADSIKPVK